jgi:hypothetical protein
MQGAGRYSCIAETVRFRSELKRLWKEPAFFRAPFALILSVPAQAGYGDKWPSQ